MKDAPPSRGHIPVSWLLQTLRHQFPAAAIALIVWGAWAYWINLPAGRHLALVASLAQGFSSFIITLVMAAVVTRLSHWLRKTRWQILFPPVLTVTCTTALLTLAHFAAGTPHLLYTLAAPSVIAFIYCAILSVKLARYDNLYLQVSSNTNTQKEK